MFFPITDIGSNPPVKPSSYTPVNKINCTDRVISKYLVRGSIDEVP